MSNESDDVVAYAFTVTPVKTSEELQRDELEELAEPFERVQFEHPDESYGKSEQFEVSNVRELTDRDNQ